MIRPHTVVLPIAGLSLLLLLNACASRPRPLASEPVSPGIAEQRLSGYESASFERPNFALRGRIGVSNGKDAGSAQFSWQQRGQSFNFDLHVAITGKRYALRGSEGAVQLVDAEGHVHRGFSAEQLLLDATGWRVPVQELRYWIRATRSPGVPSELEFSDQGRLLSLHQQGWQIVYQRWQDDPNLPLPMRIQATQGEHRVRVIVREWQSLPD